jgi:predicted thioesterase
MSDLIPGLAVGASAIVQKKVEESDAVQDMGQDTLETLLSTASMVDLILRAAIKVLKPNFPYEQGYITVGSAFSFTHLAPTSIGMKVTVRATLTEVHGNHFFFRIEAFDEVGPIGSGTHERVIVKRQSLMEKVGQRTSTLNQIR